MHLYILLLADAKGAVGRLVFDGGVPPAIEMKDMIGARQIQAGTARFQRKDEQGRPIRLVLKTLHHMITLFLGDAAVQE